MIDILSNETMLAAVVGAVAGSGVSYALGVWTERRKQTREARHAIIGELATLGHNYLATLQEMQAAKESPKSESVRPWLAQVTRLDGNLVAIQLRLWYVFPQRRVRASMSRFLTRCATVTKYLYEKAQSDQDADTAISWLATGLEELGLQAAAAARLPMRDPSRAVWVGFRMVTPEDKRRLSFEDEPPPWTFAVSFDFIRKSETAVLEKTRSNMESRAGHLRCKVHNHAAHVLLHGGGIDHFDIEMDTCCPDFGAVVGEALGTNPEKACILQRKMGSNERGDT
jgi:hypothetical protein